MENLNLINFNFIFTITLQKKVMFDLVLLVLISTCTINLEIFGHFRIARGSLLLWFTFSLFFQTVIHPLPLSVFSLSFWVATDPTKTPYPLHTLSSKKRSPMLVTGHFSDLHTLIFKIKPRVELSLMKMSFLCLK